MNKNYQNKNLNSFPVSPTALQTTILSLQNNLIKSIPPQINQYKNLTQLFIQGNKLESISKEIENLNKLTHFYAFQNQINKVPNELGNLISLQVLRLDNNQISHLPSDFFKFKKLNQLFLSNNNIKNIPEEIGELQTLTHLLLANNNLETLPFRISELRNLQQLDLSNNNLVRIPEELANLPKLTVLNLTGNSKLPLPPNINRLNAKQLLAHIIANQAPPGPELNTKKAYFFKSMSSPEILESYKENLDSLLKQDEIEYVEIKNNNDINDKVTVVFFIVAFDVYKNQNLIYKLIEKCKVNEIPYYILMQNSKRDSEGLINLSKGKEIESLRSRIDKEYSSKLIKYSNIPDLYNKIIDGLKQHTPQILIKKLKLINIGHFKNLVLDFAEDINCIIGENGTGKSTLLKSIAVAITGNNINGIIDGSIEKLLRIEGVEDKSQKIKYCDSGIIELTYTIDGEENKSIINFSNTNGDIEITQANSGQSIITNRFNMKSLILGFPQVRSSRNTSQNKKLPQANVYDLLPIINDQDQNRIKSFENWLINLYSEATQKAANNKALNLNDIDEMILINKVFSILSKVTKRDISFKSIDYDEPEPIIIVSTFDMKKGVPIKLVSEGFKVVFGWIGSFLERLNESYPMTKHDFEKEKSIILLDEVDTYIHPKWQLDFLNLLRNIFTNTQFITTSHSPLVVAGLEGKQIIDLDIVRNQVKLAKPLPEGTNYLDVSTILLSYFNMDSVISKKLQSKIDRYYKLTNMISKNKSVKDEILDLESEINKSTAGKNIYDYRFLEFIKFLERNNLTTRPKVEGIKLNPKLEAELIKELKKYE